MARQLLPLLLLICLLTLLGAARVEAQLRIVTYNTTGGPHPGLETVLAAIGPIDVLALQEQRSSATTTAEIADLLNGIYDSDIYVPATLDGGTTSASTGRPGLIFNTTSIQLIYEDTVGVDSTTGQPRQTLRYQLRPIGYGPSADFYLYNSHYKAATGTVNQNRRNVEAIAIRANLDALGDGIHAILAGDFNVYRDTEPMYVTLTADGYGKAVDPLDMPGRWSDNEEFKAIHTQAPAKDADGDGGMDDRFDFQLVTEEFLDGEGLDYIPGSYHAFGNNGTHRLNGNIDTGDGALPHILAALMTASDHLPVVADYQLPAILEVVSGAIPPSLYAGQAFSVPVTIRNAADVQVPWGADELDYVLTATGDIAGALSGATLALDNGDTHALPLNTSTVGMKTGAITVVSDGQGVAGGIVEIPVAYEVLSAIAGDYNADGHVEQGDLDLVLLNWGADAASHGWIVHLPEGTVDQQELDHVLLHWGTIDMRGPENVPEPMAAVLLLVSCAAAWKATSGGRFEVERTR